MLVGSQGYVILDPSILVLFCSRDTPFTFTENERPGSAAAEFWGPLILVPGTMVNRLWKLRPPLPVIGRVASCLLLMFTFTSARSVCSAGGAAVISTT